MADLERLKGKSFLVIGRAGMDFYADPPGTRLERATTFTAALGGSSANIAAGLTRLGCDAAIVTCVSDDAVGRFCINQLDAFGIDHRFVRTEGGEARNSLAVVETRPQDTQSVIYRNGAADFAMNENDVSTLPYHGYSALVTTGTVFAAEPSRSAAFRAFDLARAAQLPIILDVDYRPYSWQSAGEATSVLTRAAAGSDIVVGNDVEFGFLAGDPLKGLQEARNLARDSAQIVIYKMGEKGSITVSADHETRTGIFQTKAIKPTGAGDSFLAGFLASLAEGRPLDEAVQRGTAAAAIVVSRVGCAPASPTREEIDGLIAQTTMLPSD